ncbi:MAG: TlpA disulfide reductase family protein [Planctomycetota bacterium]
MGLKHGPAIRHKAPLLLCVAFLLLPACSNEKPSEKGSPTANASTDKQSPSDLALTSSSGDAAPSNSRSGNATQSSPRGVENDTVIRSTAGDRDATSASTPGQQEFIPRNMGITAPDLSNVVSEPAPENDSQEAIEKITSTLSETSSSQPGELMLQLSELDAAMRDLTVASSGRIIEPDESIRIGKRLGELKLSAGQQLANSPEANQEQRRAGVIAQLIALSHLSGLGDVTAAQQLESLAGDLSKHSDKKISHESNLILVGFSLQALQNGIEKDASAVSEQMELLLEEPQFRGFPEFLVGRRSVEVLSSMGYKEDADQVRQLLAGAYASHPDPKLRNEAWTFETQSSQARENYNAACNMLGTPNASPELLMGAARGLYAEFPSPQTLEELASSMTKIERGGFIDISKQLAELIRVNLSNWQNEEATGLTRRWLDAHDKRIGMLNELFSPTSLARLSGETLDVETYRGKMLFVDFWASDCLPCLQELPKLRRIHDQFSDQNFAILGITVDVAPDEANALVQQQRIPWDVARFSDAAGLDAAFTRSNGIDAIPFNVLVSKEGIVQRIHLTTNELESILSESLAPGDSLIP